ncbi:DUF3768 domain-containing protein [Ensifer soli]|uniref:DUF3768 domain-containing protein n=1 Tax=Ciceribacter sp. sgz301302 TaxID=3342379 RepID=UPI0035B6F57E
MSPLPAREHSGTRTMQIRALNDQLRKWPLPPLGELFLTSSVMGLPHQDRFRILRKVMDFDAFTADNDPHGEHDFGAIAHDGVNYFWKIDYYDLRKRNHSPDPTNRDVTCRVLTVMRADEY